MNSILKAVPRVFRLGSSHALDEITVLATRGNSDLLRLIASRAHALDEVRKRHGARSIDADDFASGALMVSTGGHTFPWHLKSVSIDCAGGRPPRITLFNEAGVGLPVNEGLTPWPGINPPDGLQPERAAQAIAEMQRYSAGLDGTPEGHGPRAPDGGDFNALLEIIDRHGATLTDQAIFRQGARGWTVGLHLAALRQPSSEPLDADLGEVQCPKCTFVNTKAALRHVRGGSCVNCGAPAATMLRSAEPAVPA